MEHLIGIISDTHMPRHGRDLPPAIFDIFKGVEQIIHAGDISELWVLDKLEQIAPVTAVQGNVEAEEVTLTLPIKRRIKVGPVTIGIVHILGLAARYPQTAKQEFPDAGCVVFGHSHKPYNQVHDGVLLFNLGSAMDRRREPNCTVGLLRISDEGMIRGEIIELR